MSAAPQCIASTANHSGERVCRLGRVPSGGDGLHFGKAGRCEEFTGAGRRRRPAPPRARGGWAATRRRSGRRRWTQTLTLHLVQALPVLVVLRQVLHETWQAGEGCGGTDGHAEALTTSVTVLVCGRAKLFGITIHMNERIGHLPKVLNIYD